MSKNIYEISDELQKLINDIEDNGGEVDEETEKALSIKQDELESKIDAYCHVITMTNSAIDCCKEEKNRINDIQKVKTNIVKRLKYRLLEAVKQFGETGKKGNSVLNTNTHKLFTKNTIDCRIDEERITIIATYVRKTIDELKRNNILATGEDIDLSGFVASVNAQIRAEHGDSFKPFTVQDLNYIKFNVSKSTSVLEMFSGRYDWMFDAVISMDSNFEIEVDKDNLKTNLKSYKELNLEPKTTIGTLENKESLTIK